MSFCKDLQLLQNEASIEFSKPKEPRSHGSGVANSNEDSVSLKSKFSELYKMSQDGSSVKTIDITNQFHSFYKKCEVFKYEPKSYDEIKGKYEDVKELYNIRMSPTIVDLVRSKANPKEVSLFRD